MNLYVEGRCGREQVIICFGGNRVKHVVGGFGRSVVVVVDRRWVVVEVNEKI